ncbi:uncharacterized protein LOC121552248 isoform X1 [Coregonus clupeaformis]|uniref:uncharacterized protein LOC121552248 isoform X1 n=1 Tax=Coregonus clupeaformis TaxID=59861 RepID=UPI001E1C9596|nr:uncharacterized protein LOC121552248 isoform X1 [Coregonus clupeaformis]
MIPVIHLHKVDCPGCRPDLTWLQKVTSQNLGSAPFCDQYTRKHGPCCNHSTGPLLSKPGCSASIDLTPQGQPMSDAPVMRTLPGLAAGATGLTYTKNQPTTDPWYFEGHEEEDSLSPASVYMDCLEDLSPSPSAGSPQADSPPDSPALFIIESDEGEQFSELSLSPFPVFLECEQCNDYSCSLLGERIETSPEPGGKIKSSSEKWQEIEKVPECMEKIELSPNSGQISDVSPEPEPQIELSSEHETLKGPSNLWQEIESACEPLQMIEQSPEHKQEVELFEEPLQWNEQSKEPQEVLQLTLPPKQTVEQCLQDIELPHKSMLGNYPYPNSGQELEVSTEPEQQIEFFSKPHQRTEMSSGPMIGLSPEHKSAVEPPLEHIISSTETQQIDMPNDLQQITVPSPEPDTVSKAPTEPWPETESSFGPWQDIEPFAECKQGTEVSPNSWQILKVSEVPQPKQLTELSTKKQREFKLPSEPMERNEVCTEQRLGPSMETQGVFKVLMPLRQRAKWSSGCMQLIQLSVEPMEGIDLPPNNVQVFEAFSGPKQNIEVSSKTHQGTELSHGHRQGIYLSPEHEHGIEPGQDPQRVFRLPPEPMRRNELCQEAESNTDSWQVFTVSSESNQEIETAKDLQEVFKRLTTHGQRTEQPYGCMQGFELSSESTHTIDPLPNSGQLFEKSTEDEDIDISSKLHQGNELSRKYRQGIESSPEHEQGIETSFGTKLSIESQEWTEQSPNSWQINAMSDESQQTKLSTEEESTLLPELKQINEKCPKLKQEVELTPDSLQVFEVSNELMKQTESTTESHGVFKVPLPPKRWVRRFPGYIQGSELSHESMQIIDSFANSGQIWNMSTEPKQQIQVSTRLNQGTESSTEPHEWIERSPICCQIFEMSNECQQMTKSSTETEEKFKLPPELKQNTELSSKHKQGYELTPDSWQVFQVFNESQERLEPAKESQGVFKIPLPPRKRVERSQKCMQGIDPSGQVFKGSAEPQQQIEVSSQPHQGTKLSPKPRQETEHEDMIEQSLESRHRTEISIEPQTWNFLEKLDVSTEPQQLTLGEFKLLSTLRQKTGRSSVCMKGFEVTSDSKQDTELFETQQQIEIGLELQKITEMYHSLKCQAEPSLESSLQTRPSPMSGQVLEVFPEHSTEPTSESLQGNELSCDSIQGIDPANEPMKGIGFSLEFQQMSDNTVSEQPLHSPTPFF